MNGTLENYEEFTNTLVDCLIKQFICKKDISFVYLAHVIILVLSLLTKERAILFQDSLNRTIVLFLFTNLTLNNIGNS